MARLYIPVAEFIITDKRSLLLILGFISPLIEYVRYEGGPFQVVVVALTDNKIIGQTSVKFSPARPYVVSRHWICAMNNKNQLVIFNYTYSKYKYFCYIFILTLNFLL